MSGSELVVRVEGANVGTFVLDGEIWCAVNGYEFVQWDGAGCVFRYKPGGSIGHEPHTNIKPYSVSLDAALALAERVLPGWSWELTLMPSEATWQGAPEMWPEGLAAADRGGVWATNKQASLALCAAILKAHEAGQ